MARKKAFTDEQIIEAASVLREQGKNINGTSLRLEVGSGRPSALLASFDELVSKGAIKEEVVALAVVDEKVAVESKPLPPEIEASLSVVLADLEQMVRTCNDNAHDINEKRVATEIKNSRKATEVAEIKVTELDGKLSTTLEILGGVEEQRDEFEDQLNESRLTVTELEKKVAELTKETTILAGENKTLTDNEATLKADVIKLGLESSAFEKAYNDSDTLNKTLDSDNKLLNGDLRVSESKREEQANIIQNLESKLTAMTDTLNIANTDNTVKDKSIEQSQSEIKSLEVAAKKLESTVDQQNKDLTVIQVESRLKDEAVTNLTEQNSQYSEQLTAMQIESRLKDEAITNLTEQNSQYSEQLAAMKKDK